MIDQLKVFRGADYELNSQIKIRQPTLDEICTYGEQSYFGLVKTLCSTPADRKVEIWESLHIFWDKMDEFELFISLVLKLQQVDLSILFPELDFTSFTPVVKGNINEIVLVNRDGVVFDRSIHSLLTNYLRQIHQFQKNTDVGYDDYTKEIMIEDDKEEQEKWANKPFQSVLYPMISSLTNCPEFKYRFDDVWTLPIGAFMDCVARIQKHKNYSYMMQGIYSGCVDIKKINKKELNWMGELK